MRILLPFEGLPAIFVPELIFFMTQKNIPDYKVGRLQTMILVSGGVLYFLFQVLLSGGLGSGANKFGYILGMALIPFLIGYLFYRLIRGKFVEEPAVNKKKVLKGCIGLVIGLVIMLLLSNPTTGRGSEDEFKNEIKKVYDITSLGDPGYKSEDFHFEFVRAFYLYMKDLLAEKKSYEEKMDSMTEVEFTVSTYKDIKKLLEYKDYMKALIDIDISHYSSLIAAGNKFIAETKHLENEIDKGASQGFAEEFPSTVEDLNHKIEVERRLISSTSAYVDFLISNNESFYLEDGDLVFYKNSVLEEYNRVFTQFEDDTNALRIVNQDFEGEEDQFIEDYNKLLQD